MNLNGRLCGGTLIAPSIILTASHCLAGYLLINFIFCIIVLNIDKFLIFLRVYYMEQIYFFVFSNSLAASSVSKFRVIVNTISINGESGSITRGVRKFVMHSQYNSKTMVCSYSSVPC